MYFQYDNCCYLFYNNNFRMLYLNPQVCLKVLLKNSTFTMLIK